MGSKLRDGWLGQTLRGTEKVNHMRGMSNSQLAELLGYMPDTAPHSAAAQRSRLETFTYMFDRDDRGINLILARRPDLPGAMKQILHEAAVEGHDMEMIEALSEGERPMQPYFGNDGLRVG